MSTVQDIGASPDAVPAAPRPLPSETVVAAPEPPEASSGMLDVHPEMVALAWIAFGLIAAVLSKVLWKPVLKALESREAGIREALDGAEKARAEVAGAAKRSRAILDSAEKTSLEKVEEARRQADALRSEADRSSRELAEARVREAEARIASEVEQAGREVKTAVLADIAGSLEKVLAQELTPEQKRRYQDAMLREADL